MSSVFLWLKVILVTQNGTTNELISNGTYLSKLMT